MILSIFTQLLFPTKRKGFFSSSKYMDLQRILLFLFLIFFTIAQRRFKASIPVPICSRSAALLKMCTICISQQTQILFPMISWSLLTMLGVRNRLDLGLISHQNVLALQHLVTYIVHTHRCTMAVCQRSNLDHSRGRQLSIESVLRMGHNFFLG